MKILWSRVMAYIAVLLMIFFCACSDDITEVTKVNEIVGVQIVKSGESRPECLVDNNGSMIFLEDSSKVYYCADKKWSLFKGKDGTVGPTGPKGNDGAKGDDGDAGRQGEKGDKGDKGDSGVQGEKGDRGDDGEQGKKGESGDKGDSGIQGEKGKTGDSGNSGNDGASCSVQALQDGSGYKVVCGKDSVGVLLHGKDLFIFASSSSMSSSSVGPDESIYDAENNTLTDLRDGHVYKTVTIESWSYRYSKVWMAENLNYRYHQKTKNGTDADSSSYCYKEKLNASCGKYGRLYLWSAAMDSAAWFSTDGAGCGQGVKCVPKDTVRGVCPKGWHLPNKDEMKRLIDIAGGESKAAIKLKSVDDWQEDENNSGTDEYGFAMLPAGDYCGSGYTNLHQYGFLWTSSEKNQDHGYHLWLWYFKAEAELGPFNKYCAFSVRCVKD